MTTNNQDHAVVLGGGISGLLTAAVLSEHYPRVTIVERDRLPSGPLHRRGVPQGHHVHGLLPSGLRVMEDLLPGITQEYVTAGALPGDILAHMRWYLGGQRLLQVHTGLTAVSASRPLLEGVLRRRVLAAPNITVLDGYDVVGICSAPDEDTGRRITGAQVSGRDGEGSRVVTAGLVVDATGRASRASGWLADLGIAAPPRDEVTIDLAYMSRIFAAPPRPFGDDIVVVTARFPGQQRSAVMQRLEGDRVLVTLAGILGERPPADLDGFAEYAATLAAPDTHELIRTAQPVGDPIPFRIPSYTRHRYERLTGFPAGLFVTGDAICAFNPVYGQGMSVAALAAAALRTELRLGGPDPHRYFEAVARILDAPWGIAVGADLGIPGVTGPALPKSPLTGEYLGQLQRAAVHDPVLATAFIRVTSLIDPPPALLAPDIVARVPSPVAGVA